MNKSLLALLLGMGFFLDSFAGDSISVKSPSNTIVYALSNSKGQLQFNITSRGRTVLKNSILDFSLNGNQLTSTARIIRVERYKYNQTYAWLGAHSLAKNNFNGAKLFVQSGKTNFQIDIRVFDDGAAYQVRVPNSTKGIPDEATTFTLPTGAYIWYHDMNMHYEGVHIKKKIDSVANGEWVAPPATFKLEENLYASITEADLKNYGGFSLQADGKNGLTIRLPQHQPTSYPYKLRYSPDDTLRLSQPATIDGPIITPWRVVMVGDLNALVNCDIVHNLCPPADPKLFPKGINTSWIKPGRAVWKYLDGGGDGTPEVMKKFTDGAASLGFEHNILEGFWRNWTDDQIRDLVNYSKQKGVGIWLWKHSKNLRDADSSELFFRKCQDLGITGAKIDFFDHEAKEEIDLYQRLLRQAASYHILLDFHGANKPTGQSRTWPNELTREAVKGMEARSIADRATHETTIPFTRFLAGPAEYTVLLFGDRRKNTTWAHQIASAAILSAPMLTYAANPENILTNPAAEIIKAIPSTWDETIVLPGSDIGELAAYARRKGNKWFIAIMNGVNPKMIHIPLSFLKSSVNYRVTIVRDKMNDPADLMMENELHKCSDELKIDLPSGGGYVAMFTIQ